MLGILFDEECSAPQNGLARPWHAVTPSSCPGTDPETCGIHMPARSLETPEVRAKKRDSAASSVPPRGSGAHHHRIGTHVVALSGSPSFQFPAAYVAASRGSPPGRRPSSRKDA